MHDCWKFKCLNLHYVRQGASNHQLGIQELSKIPSICAKPWFFPILEHGEGRLRCNSRIPRGIGINPITHGPFDLAAPQVPTKDAPSQIFKMETVILPVCFFYPLNRQQSSHTQTQHGSTWRHFTSHLLEAIRASFWNATIGINFGLIFLLGFFLETKTGSGILVPSKWAKQTSFGTGIYVTTSEVYTENSCENSLTVNWKSVY